MSRRTRVLLVVAGVPAATALAVYALTWAALGAIARAEDEGREVGS